MRKSIESNVIKYLNRFSERDQLTFLKLWLKSNEASILDLKGTGFALSTEKKLSQFHDQIILTGNTIIFKSGIEWQFGVKALKENLNAHSKPRKAIAEAGLPYCFETGAWLVENELHPK